MPIDKTSIFVLMELLADKIKCGDIVDLESVETALLNIINPTRTVADDVLDNVSKRQ